MSEPESCERCRFWLATTHGEGQCRRWPPQSPPVITSPGAWCGEFSRQRVLLPLADTSTDATH